MYVIEIHLLMLKLKLSKLLGTHFSESTFFGLSGDMLGSGL